MFISIGRTTILVFAMFAYLLFLVAFVSGVVFVSGFGRSSLDDARGALWPGLPFDLALIALFGAQHSFMARRQVKIALRRVVPDVAERSLYVALASFALLAVIIAWQPLPLVVWSFDGAPALALRALAFSGWGLVVAATFMTGHFEMFGVAQALRHALGRPAASASFTTRWAYGLVRHPLMLGMLIAFWATPRMTGGHGLFALAMTGYIGLGIALEERDLVRDLGITYERYRARVPMLVPVLELTVLRRKPRQDTVASFDWVAGEILPGEPNWAPRFGRALRDAPRT